MPETIEIERRQRRRYDTGLASTYQLDHIRKTHGYRAIVVATDDGQMLIGSMDEPVARVLAAYTGAIGTVDESEREALERELVEQQFDGAELALRVDEFQLGGIPLYLGIVAPSDADVTEASRRAMDGLQRIFAST